jgi:hypothetical protein
VKGWNVTKLHSSGLYVNIERQKATFKTWRDSSQLI